MAQGIGIFTSITQVKDSNEKAGLHFFDQDTMRFFGSKIHGGIIYGRYFITSEDNFDRSEKSYTARIAHADGKIDTLGGFPMFNKFRTRKEAKAQIEAAYRSGPALI